MLVGPLSSFSQFARTAVIYLFVLPGTCFDAFGNGAGEEYMTLIQDELHHFSLHRFKMAALFVYLVIAQGCQIYAALFNDALWCIHNTPALFCYSSVRLL